MKNYRDPIEDWSMTKCMLVSLACIVIFLLFIVGVCMTIGALGAK